MASDLVTFIKKRDAQLREVMREEVENAIVAGKTYHQNAVRNWKKKPKWVIHSEQSKNEIRTVMEAAGDMRDIWGWVDKGTGSFTQGGSPYWIFPRRPGGKLSFQSGYNPKTRAIAKANVGDGSHSGAWVSSEGVLHPGIKGRKFSETYRERIFYPTLKPQIVKRVRRT